jgi:transposase
MKGLDDELLDYGTQMTKRHPRSQPTWTDVKAKLADLDRTNLMGLVQDLYAAHKDNQTFLHTRFGLGEDVLKPYKETLERWLWPDVLRNQDISVAKAKQAISSYRKAVGEPAGLAELMVSYCESAAGFSDNIGYGKTPLCTGVSGSGGGRMLGMLKRHEIEILLKAGHSKVEVARLSGASLRSVKRVAQEGPVMQIDDGLERAQRQIGRPSQVASFRKPVMQILEQVPDLSSVEILRRVREAGYQGGKSALYSLISSLRPKSSKPLVRFEGLAGEFSQHDFGQVEVEFVDGSSRRVHFFASRLKYSRYMCVSLVEDEAVESLVRGLAEHLASWGGAPLQCVFDRPKTIALAWKKNGEVTEWNSVFAYATLEMGIGVELCWPYSPQQKGSVENLVGFVKSSFFKVRRFHDEQDLRQQLRDWHREVNEERPSRATGVIPALRLAEERTRLRPLKVQPEELALRIPVYVGPTGTVLHDGHAYSMPPESISMPATLYLYAQRVRIVAGRHEAVHPRKFVAHEGSSLAEHRAALVAAVSGKRGKRYLKRQQLLELGEPAIRYLTEIVHRRPRQWFEDVDRLHVILQDHGPQVLRLAMESGLREQVFGASYVERSLQPGLSFPETIQ